MSELAQVYHAGAELSNRHRVVKPADRAKRAATAVILATKRDYAAPGARARRAATMIKTRTMPPARISKSSPTPDCGNCPPVGVPVPVIVAVAVMALVATAVSGTMTGVLITEVEVAGGVSVSVGAEVT